MSIRLGVYLKMITLKTGPDRPFIMADAFKWHRPCKTTPFTCKKFNNKTIHTHLLTQLRSKFINSVDTYGKS